MPVGRAGAALDQPVRWAQPLPVYMECWPRLFVSPATAFEEAILEVYRENSQEQLRLRFGSGIPLVESAGKTFLDLSAVAALRSWDGMIHLRGRLPGRPDHPPLTATLLRSSALALSYVPDPQADHAQAVAIQAQVRIEPGADTQLFPGPNGQTLLCCADAVSVPVVSCRLPEQQLQPQSNRIGMDRTT